MSFVFTRENKNAPDPKEIVRQTKAQELKNMKGNDIMKNNKETRMEILHQNGIDTGKFFAINLLNILVDTPVSINIGGNVYDLTLAKVESDKNNPDKIVADFIDAEGKHDDIETAIINNGYVFNRRTDGRFITAQTFKMLNEMSYNSKTGKYEYGWDAYLRNNYSYMYQFDMVADELKKLSKMQSDNDPEFERLNRFFTLELVVSMCKNYMNKLKKYVKTLNVKNCKGRPYVTLPYPYRNVFINELYRVYGKVDCYIKIMQNDIVRNNKDYKTFYNSYKSFLSIIIDLPDDTPKCSEWKDVFKAKGAYVTLLNIVKFHNVKVHGMNVYDSVKFIEDYTKSLKTHELWRLHILLKEVIEENNFNLDESICNKLK